MEVIEEGSNHAVALTRKRGEINVDDYQEVDISDNPIEGYDLSDLEEELMSIE